MANYRMVFHFEFEDIKTISSRPITLDDEEVEGEENELTEYAEKISSQISDVDDIDPLVITTSTGSLVAINTGSVQYVEFIKQAD